MEICDLQNVECRAGTSPRNTLRCLWPDWKKRTSVDVSRSCIAVVQDLPSSCSVSRNKIPLKASGLCHTAQVPRRLGDHRRRRKVLDRYGYLQGAEAWRQQPCFRGKHVQLGGLFRVPRLGKSSKPETRPPLLPEHCSSALRTTAPDLVRASMHISMHFRNLQHCCKRLPSILHNEAPRRNPASQVGGVEELLLFWAT